MVQFLTNSFHRLPGILNPEHVPKNTHDCAYIGAYGNSVEYAEEKQSSFYWEPENP